ncbi:tRNA (N6-isopentenyl adenosine(37)-C2)-methylthiotransferase MiaB, partial [Thermodesulfobacteriota bacterium]
MRLGGHLSRFFHIATMGCQMNEYESNHLGQMLLHLNYLPTDNPREADILLVNTCTVRAKAEQKAFSLIGRLAALKKRNPNLILGICGCVAQQEGADLLERFPALDIVMGTRESYRFQEILSKVQDENKRVVATDMDSMGRIPQSNINGFFSGRIKSYISIMQGCNNFCSYCIVPYVRGREACRAPEDILDEAKQLVSEGVKEITLLGQNVNSYRWKDEGEIDFAWLLNKLNSIKGIQRIRFTTSHPKDLSDDLIGCFGDLAHLCPHIHLPFQAGSNRILKRMNRGYTQDAYLGLIDRLRRVRPEMAITSDVMVGFPGESEKDFQMTLDLIARVEFDNLYSFKYSDRKGTLAAEMMDKIAENEKSAR